MTPNIEEKHTYVDSQEITDQLKAEAKPREYRLVWYMVVIFVVWHTAALYGLYLSFTAAKWATLLFNVFIYMAQTFGVIGGAHRLWAHRAYKAKLPLQIILMLCQTMSWQKTVFYWARDHRIHHKYSDTDADPHNASRGFFFSHIGWLMAKKHPDVIEKGKTVDVSDLTANPVLQFQTKYYKSLSYTLAFIMPVVVPVYFWQESINVAHHVSLFRLILSAHAIYSINSVTHMFGNKPYDKTILPTQNIPLSLANLGEGFHNYHHVFPFDYRAAELGNTCINITTILINFFAWIGWAYDLKYATDDMIRKRAMRTGDGTDLWGREQEVKDQTPNIWGWGDRDMPEEDKKALRKLE